MRLSSVVAACVTMLSFAVAAPIRRATRPITQRPWDIPIKVTFAAGTPSMLINYGIQEMLKKGGEILKLPDWSGQGQDHEKWFIAVLSAEAEDALMAAIGQDVPVTLETTNGFVGQFCPEDFCKENGQ